MYHVFGTLMQEVEQLWAEKREKEAQIAQLDLELQQVCLLAQKE